MNLQNELNIFPDEVKEIIKNVVFLMRQHCSFNIANEATFITALCEGYEKYKQSYLSSIIRGIDIYTKGKHYKGKGERYLLAIINNIQNEREIRYELEQHSLNGIPPEVI